jgi:hypothetical protein
MTLTGNDILAPEWVRHQLEGAYIAQSWGSLPLIRLLPANPGSHLNQWEPVVDALLGLPGTDRLVAATGIGLSLETARAAIQGLSDHRIPVVASPLAADEFSEIPGFLRVSPTSSTYSMAAAGYVKPAAHTATIVQDDDNADLYPKTLATAFTQRFVDADHRITGRTERYDSSLPGVENTFLQMMPNICGDQPDVVYFAGRENDLTAFVAELAQRPCLARHLTVLTGDLAQSGPPGPEMRRGLQSNVAILAHDAVLTVVWAIRQIRGGRALPGDRAGRAPGEKPPVRHPRRPGRERHDLPSTSAATR